MTKQKLAETAVIRIEYEAEASMETIRRVQIECAVRKMIEELAERCLLRGIKVTIRHQ